MEPIQSSSQTGSQVWVLDETGYDVRGGSARVFSTPELAKQAVPWVEEWVETDWGWEEHAPDSLGDIWVIYRHTIDAVDA